MLSVVQNDLMGHPDVFLHFLRHRLPRVQIPVEAWKVAARNVKADSVTRLEDIARLPERDLHLVTLFGRQELRLFARLPISGSPGALGDQDGATVRMHVG